MKRVDAARDLFSRVGESLADRLSSKSRRQAITLKSAVLIVTAQLMEYQDGFTGQHVSRTRKYMQLLVEALLRKKSRYRQAARWDPDFFLASAQLHDIGKLAISSKILNKPGRLTESEFEKIKEHVPVGVAIIERIENVTGKNVFLRHAKVMAETHHEKWDGSGYPHGLKGWEIPLEGRLMAIADVYDALTSARPYKQAITPEEAEIIIVRDSGTHFDPFLIDVFQDAAPRLAMISRAEGVSGASGIAGCESAFPEESGAIW
jgi:putative two-component system response regulator